MINKGRVKKTTEETRYAVKSLVSAVYYTCTTTYESFAWVKVGDVQEMTLQQLRIMKVKHPRYFTERWLMPMDDEVIKTLRLENVYTNKLNRGDTKKLCGNDVQAAEELLLSLNSDAIEELKDKAIRDVKKGTISNAKIIRLLEKHLGVELMQYA